jgi:hypothetical protein
MNKSKFRILPPIENIITGEPFGKPVASKNPKPSKYGIMVKWLTGYPIYRSNDDSCKTPYFMHLKCKPDNYSEIINKVYKNPIPLLLDHDFNKEIGVVKNISFRYDYMRKRVCGYATASIHDNEYAQNAYQEYVLSGKKSEVSKGVKFEGYKATWSKFNDNPILYAESFMIDEISIVDKAGERGCEVFTNLEFKPGNSLDLGEYG